MVEDCRTNGSAGKLHFLGVMWWDSKAHTYQFFTCANQSGCEVRGGARWEGNSLVNSWEEIEKGKRVAYKDSFVDINDRVRTMAPVAPRSRWMKS